VNLERLLRLLFLGLAVFDFVLGTIFVFFGQKLFLALHLEAYAQPQFFMMCVGLFLYQYVYIQYMAFKNPYKHSTCLNMTVLIRLTFPIVYISSLFLWGLPITLLHIFFAISAVGDIVVSFFILYSMKKLKISFFRGDKTPVSFISKDISILQIVLLVLALSEFVISWNWILIPKIWLDFFEITNTIDPVWARATGVFLLNIAYIQFLGFWDIHKYKTAVITSGLFRALWPLLYWYWTAFGEGNFLFKLFIMFFSFFDTVACFVIFYLLKIMQKENHTETSQSSSLQDFIRSIKLTSVIQEKYFPKLLFLLAIWDFCLGMFFIVFGYTLLKKFGLDPDQITLPGFFVQWTGFFIILQAIAHYLLYLDIWNVRMFWLNFLFRAAVGGFHLLQYIFLMHSIDPLISITLVFFISGDLSTGGLLFAWYIRKKEKYKLLRN
jgi:hypothetical protein